MKEKPLVSIIIVNWNGESIIGECLSSVAKTSYPNIETIVVDNNSADKSIEVIRKYSNVSLYRNGQNSGYTGGNNIGFQIAKGKYVVTLNNDMVVDPEWLTRPVDLLEKYRDVGIVSCRQMQYFQPELIDSLFNELKSDLSFSPFGFNKKHKFSKLSSTSGLVLCANGGSAILRKEMLDQIGGFDEHFFGYYDETDLCFRAFLRGWKCVYEPDSVVFHMGGSSFKQNEPRRYYLRERNRFWFIYKFMPLSFIINKFHLFLLMELRVMRIFFFKCKTPGLYFKARFDGISNFKRYRSTRMENIRLFNQKKRLFKKYLKLKILDLDTLKQIQ